MKGYRELAKLYVFSMTDVEDLTGNKKTASSLVSRLIKQDLVRKIKKNMYSCINVATEEVFASKYQIACASSETAYLSHHAAFEFYGMYNQVYYEVYVSSESKFKDFEYENVWYKYVDSKMQDGVVTPEFVKGVRVTDLERTVVDGIKDFGKTGGIEEFLNCLSMVSYLSADKMVKYLDGYGIQALYQKTGYILDYYKESLCLPNDFVEYCREKMGNGTGYLTKEMKHKHVYDNKWKLIVPKGLFDVINQGGGYYV